MDAFSAAYAAAFTLGVAHALEVDHMVAVTAFVGGNPRFGTAASFGIRWGIGHALTVLVAGSLLAWSGMTVPAVAQRWAELGVGLALIGVGVWAWHNARRLHLHDPRRHGGHGHLHAHDGTGANHEHAHPPDHDRDHPADTDRRHAHLSTVVGAVHGLSGTAPVVALIPVTLMPSFGAAVGYLLAFGIGTTVGMGAYAALAALGLSRAGASLKLARAVAFATAAASVAVGLWWLLASAVGTGG
ncbi:MAG: hypothetical protein HY700_01875 [Gemmatimonadetes bacterium]|nr:hypothetical protein [Gemmatimonadota bacterium]